MLTVVSSQLQVLEVAGLEPVEVQVVVREHRPGSRLADHVQVEQPALQVEVLGVRPGRHDQHVGRVVGRVATQLALHLVPRGGAGVVADAREALRGADAPCDRRLEHADVELLRARGFRRRIEAHARCRRAITRAVVAQDAGRGVVAHAVGVAVDDFEPGRDARSPAALVVGGRRASSGCACRGGRSRDARSPDSRARTRSRGSPLSLRLPTAPPAGLARSRCRRRCRRRSVCRWRNRN